MPSGVQPSGVLGIEFKVSHMQGVHFPTWTQPKSCLSLFSSPLSLQSFFQILCHSRWWSWSVLDLVHRSNHWQCSGDHLCYWERLHWDQLCMQGNHHNPDTTSSAHFLLFLLCCLEALLPTKNTPPPSLGKKLPEPFSGFSWQHLPKATFPDPQAQSLWLPHPFLWTPLNICIYLETDWIALFPQACLFPASILQSGMKPGTCSTFTKNELTLEMPLIIPLYE